MTKPPNDKMIVLLDTLRLSDDDGWLPRSPNEIAYRMGYSHGGKRRGNGAAGKGGWAGWLAPAQRIISTLRGAETRGLVHYARRRDDRSGTAYVITPNGREFLHGLSEADLLAAHESVAADVATKNKEQDWR